MILSASAARSLRASPQNLSSTLGSALSSCRIFLAASPNWLSGEGGLSPSSFNAASVSSSDTRAGCTKEAESIVAPMGGVSSGTKIWSDFGDRHASAAVNTISPRSSAARLPGAMSAATHTAAVDATNSCPSGTFSTRAPSHSETGERGAACHGS